MHTVTVNGLATTPSKIVCIGRNYAAHIEELGNEVPDDMVVFVKPNSAIGTSLRAQQGEPLHYEGELAFTVAGGRLAAVGFGLDLTKRALQSHLKKNGLPWERAKAFDGAALFSEFVSLPDDINQLVLELDVNRQARQRGHIGLMLYPPLVILDQLAKFMSLEDGDIIMTGTPAGVGAVNAEESFEGRVLYQQQVLVSHRWQAL